MSDTRYRKYLRLISGAISHLLKEGIRLSLTPDALNYETRSISTG